MKKAIVTGGSSGIGMKIAEVLLKNDWEVYSFGRDFTQVEDASNLNKIELDLLDTVKLVDTINKINSAHDIDLVINNAGVGFYGLHEELNPNKISTMVRTNLEVPMIISNLLLRDLKKNNGTIINIASVTANESNPHGASYGATKAGLLSFSRSIFDEVRKYGVKVTTILPDMTDTNLYRNADFTIDDDLMAFLKPDDVANMVDFILKLPANQVLTEVTIKPQFKRIKRKNSNTQKQN